MANVLRDVPQSGLCQIVAFTITFPANDRLLVKAEIQDRKKICTTQF
jgi:hypothetical protein